MNIRDLCLAAHATSVSKGWYDDCDGPLTIAMTAEKLCLCHSEISEALEEVRTAPLLMAKKFPDLSYRFEGENGKPEGFLVELADLIIRVGDLVAKAGLEDEFVKAIEDKMAFNKTRSHRHGNKHC